MDAAPAPQGGGAYGRRHGWRCLFASAIRAKMKLRDRGCVLELKPLASAIRAKMGHLVGGWGQTLRSQKKNVTGMRVGVRGGAGWGGLCGGGGVSAWSVAGVLLEFGSSVAGGVFRVFLGFFSAAGRVFVAWQFVAEGFFCGLVRNGDAQDGRREVFGIGVR